MAESLRILILEDDFADAERVKSELEEAGFVFTSKVVRTEEEYVQALQDFFPELILCDYDLPKYNGVLALAQAKRTHPDTPFILLTEAAAEDHAIEIYTQGADDYVLKNHSGQRLVQAVQRVLAEAEQCRLCRKAESEFSNIRRTLEKQLQERTAELWKSRERLSLALTSSRMGIFEWDIVENKRYWDDNLHFLLGTKPENFSGTAEDLFKVIHPEDRNAVQAFMFEAIKHNSPFEIVYRVVWPDGSVHNIEVRGKVLHDDAGRPVQVIGVCCDITDRKRAEEALRESESLYRLLADNMTDAVWLMDVNLNMTYVSPSAENMRGYTLKELMQLPLDKHLTPASLKVAMALFSDEASKVAADPTYVVTPTTELEFYRKDGTTYWAECTFRIIPDEKGNSVSILGEGRDITERKRAEEEKAKLQDQLIQYQKMESIGRLAGGVAHDFNNMLGVILGHVEMAMEQTDPTHPLCSHLRAIGNAAHHSTELTRQLLAFARKQVISPKVLDVNDTIEGMIKMLRRLIGENIGLSWLPGRDLWPVKVDPSQIDQILANLCVNARDAITGMGMITIETGNISFDEAHCADHVGCFPGDYVLLAVSDNGCGMDKETLDKLFEPFFTTKELRKGTGLGLATVYGIVKQNNGFIDVSSEPGQGTAFRIYLPRHDGKAEQVQTARPREPAGGGQETILVVEDEPEILHIARRMLEKQGYRVLTAGTPGEAIRLAEEHAGEIHLLVTDVVMPEMNGRDLAKKMLSLYPDMKRLFMSGYTADIIADHGVLDDGVHFIQKPFSMKDLVTKVREVLDQK